ncbi:MAG: hypothetical protein CFK52_04620 [Chloracidobacterium sp. CP2_5A]|nr:MAG: hypothetical protein CFK52_04620 [Chloracidobacterium sp. CP2_5A]
MPPTVWCAQHAARFPFAPDAVEQVCPAGHGLRLEGVTGYCPACDLYWDMRQVERPDACPYCQAPDATLRLCQACELMTYWPREAPAHPRCPGCGASVEGEALPHACRLLRVTFVTQRRQCPTCREPIERSPAPVIAASATSAASGAPTVVREDSLPAAATDAAPAVTVAPDGIALVAPIQARELHQRYLPRLIRVHFDYNLRRFFRNEKGLFYACGVGAPPSAYHIIPSWSRFGVAGDFTHWFSEIFDCEQPSGGDIWVHAPAVADAEGALLRKGQLEVNRPPAASPASRTVAAPPSPLEAPAPPPAAKARCDAETAPPAPELPKRPATAPPAAPKPSEPAPEAAAPPPADQRRRRWLPWLAAGAIAVGIGGLGIWKTYVAPQPAAQAPEAAAPRIASRPNQPQAENQTSQEAILAALDGLAQAFTAQQVDHYLTYFDATLRPYYGRREETAERAVSDMAKLWETYAELSMTHKAPQVQLDAKGATATAIADRTLTGRHRLTGASLNDTTRVAYRFIKRDRRWLVAGAQVAPPAKGK